MTETGAAQSGEPLEQQLRQAFAAGVLDLLVVVVRIGDGGAGGFVQLGQQLAGPVVAEIEAGSAAAINQVHHHRHAVSERLGEADRDRFVAFGQDREGLAEQLRHALCPGAGRNHHAVAVDRFGGGLEPEPRPDSIGADKWKTLAHGATLLAQHPRKHARELVGIEETVVRPEQAAG